VIEATVPASLVARAVGIDSLPQAFRNQRRCIDFSFVP
jgi:hypothetical protein